VVITRDITERKQTEAQLIVSDRMASLGALAAGVAHEINNPLACVTGFLALAGEELETLAKRQTIPSQLLEEISDAREAAERVRTIVRDLKIFSRGEETKIGPVNVERVLESTLRMTWNELRHRARVTKVFANVPAVAANEPRLGQVFLNLLVNAAQAIPEGDYARNEVRLETRLDGDGRHVVVSIADTGAGIPADVQRRLFTPFVTTKAVGVGTGLGLSICHRIVVALGGRIDFTSDVGRGTTFRVTLPIATVEKAADAAPVGGRTRASRRGKVLIVDDDALVTGSIQRILASEHDVRVVHSASEALTLVELGQRFDVVLCDLMMPQITGMDLYHALAALDRGQAEKMVFMTGGAFTQAARTFLESVPNLRLEKPFEVQQLRDLVNGLVR
jgi:nitrogen-specific signal transduction histidine kinase/CheY-like chemotaxis protein